MEWVTNLSSTKISMKIPNMISKSPLIITAFDLKRSGLKCTSPGKLEDLASFKIGPAFQRIGIEKPEDDQDRFISDYSATVPYDLFSEHNGYAGTSWNITIDKKNSIQ